MIVDVACWHFDQAVIFEVQSTEHLIYDVYKVLPVDDDLSLVLAYVIEHVRWLEKCDSRVLHVCIAEDHLLIYVQKLDLHFDS